jgi:hypothetical protein
MAPTTRKTLAPTVDEESTEDIPTVGTVDVEALVRTLQEQVDKQNAHIKALLADRGIPSDPVAAQILALQDHLKAQANANPNHAEAYAPVLSYVAKLKSEGLTDKQAYKARNLVEDLHDTHAAHELAYARQLAKGLHTMTLDTDGDDEQ